MFVGRGGAIHARQEEASMAVPSTTPRHGPEPDAPDELVCPACRRPIDAADQAWRLRLCPACGHHLTMSAAERIASLADPGSFQETTGALVSADPLTFADTRTYPERLAEAKERTGLTEAVVIGTARDQRPPVRAGRLRLRVHWRQHGHGRRREGGAGDRAGDRARAAVHQPSAASGGARMQEGMLSLVQMAKTTRRRDRACTQAGLPFISRADRPDDRRRLRQLRHRRATSSWPSRAP